MTRHHIVFLTLVVAGLGCDCEGKMLITDDGGADADVDASDTSVPLCAPVNDTCTAEFPCCEGLTCDPGTSTCVAAASGCGLFGTTCMDPGDCCSGACSMAGTCAATCVQNTQACTVNGDCCSGNCMNDVCVAATGSFCTTTGNACGSDASCCSSNCVDSVCAPTGASCIAFGDTCYEDDDCCSARCSEDETGVGGICISLGVSGTGSCRMAGEPCGDCGSCCSRTCVPTSTGGSVCLQASGCALESELCETSADCCGSMASGAGTQVCSRADVGDELGRCTLTGTTPDGNVCKSATPWCSASIAPSNCGNCQSPKAQCCRIDPNGTPRCFGGSTPQCPAGYDSNDPNCCAAPGAVCNFTGECCGGAPCLPDGSGVLRCGASCSPVDAACSTSADCCTGLTCNIELGEMLGTCEQPVVPPPVDGGVPMDGGTPVCAQFGQACGDTQACCSGIGCQSPATGLACAQGETGCSCFGIIIE